MPNEHNTPANHVVIIFSGENHVQAVFGPRSYVDAQSLKSQLRVRPIDRVEICEVQEPRMTDLEYGHA